MWARARNFPLLSVSRQELGYLGLTSRHYTTQCVSGHAHSIEQLFRVACELEVDRFVVVLLCP